SLSVFKITSVTGGSKKIQAAFIPQIERFPAQQAQRSGIEGACLRIHGMLEIEPSQWIVGDLIGGIAPAAWALVQAEITAVFQGQGIDRGGYRNLKQASGI